MFREWWYVLGKHVQQQPNRKHEKISTLFVVLENKSFVKTQLKTKLEPEGLGKQASKKN